MGLGPLKQFGIAKVIATTMQAISGAGYPGVPSMDINANVVPFIGGEEEKMEQETQKILGELRGDSRGAAGGPRQRPLQPRAGGGRPHRDGFRRADRAAFRRRYPARVRTPSVACRRSANCPAPPGVRCSTCSSRTARSPAKTQSASAAWLPSWAVCVPARCSTGSSWRSATIRCAARPGAAVLNAELMHSEGMLD